MTKSASAPSSNWEKLKQKLPAETPRPKGKHIPAHSKRSKNGFSKGLGAFKNALAEESISAPSAEAGPSRPPAKEQYKKVEGVMFLPSPSDKPLLNELRSMVAGLLPLNEAKKAPGNYVAIDCEMVGMGHMGSESALARVSLVNYHGHVLLDTFVQPREKVTDWRTWVSGVRESDMIGAPSFEEVQKQVAAMIEGRILIGHAVENDMKALLLSHPNPLLRDTQKCKQLRERAKTKRPGLKKLTESELGLKIQAGSHSSVTDARATMALYRLVKPEWEASLRSVMETYREKTGMAPLAKGGKRKRQEGAGEDGDEDEEAEGATSGKRGKKEAPGGGRKGISSGLSVVVRRFGKKVEDEQPKRRGPAPAAKASTGGSWWEEAAG